MALTAQTGSKHGDDASTATQLVAEGTRQWPGGMCLGQRQLLVQLEQMPNLP